MFDLNPLDVLKQRRVTYAASHFAELLVSDSEIFEGVEDWVKNKLKGRYYIVKKPALDKNNVLKSSYYIGFEDQKELTYFMLACPQLRRT
jgi:hypothetical protein